MNAADSMGPPALVDELFSRLAPRRGQVVAGWALALSLHAGLGLFALTQRVAERTTDVPLEIELLAPPPPPPPPEPEPEPEPVAKAPEPVAPKPVIARAPAAAAAPNVLTAKPDPEATPSAEPFDFTSDPRSTMLGAGVVAVGGTAAFGVQGAKADGVGSKPVIQPVGDGLTAASDLSRKPSLPGRDPCKGYFPRSARDDAADVAVRVVVGKDGRVTNAQILSESITRQGFGAAAKACMLEQRFEPALDRAGAAAATAIRVNVRFSR